MIQIKIGCGFGGECFDVFERSYVFWMYEGYPENKFRRAINTFAASYLNTQGLNNSSLKSPASTLVDLTFQSRALRSFSLNQLRNLSL